MNTEFYSMEIKKKKSTVMPEGRGWNPTGGTDSDKLIYLYYILKSH